MTSIAVVTSSIDDQIDLPLAEHIPQTIAAANGLTLHKSVLPADWKIVHDIVDANDDVVAKRKDYLFELYFDYYEGRNEGSVY